MDGLPLFILENAMAKVGELLVQVLVDSKQGVQEIQKFGKVVNTVSTTSAKNFEQVQDEIRQLDRTASQSRGMTGLANRIKQNWLAITGAIAAVGLALRKVSDLETRMANVASLGVQNISGLTQEVERLSLRLPATAGELADGLYQVVSAGVDAQNQIQVLEATAKAASAGLAKTTDAINLAASVIKGYGLAWTETEKIMDLAFQTVKLGQTTFPELAANIGQVVPLAATLKISTEELFGAFATLTGVTGNTSEVATQLKSVMASLAAPTAEMTALMQAYGFSSVEAAANQLGLAGILQIVQKETGGSAAATEKLFKRIEATNAVLALSTTSYDTFVKKTKQMDSATGEMSNAFAVNTDTMAAKMQLLRNAFDALIRNVVRAIVPSIKPILSFLAELDQGTKRFITTVGLLTVAGWKLVPMIRAVNTSVTVLGVSLKTALGWIGLIVAAATLLWSAWSSNLFGIQGVVKTVWKFLKAFFQSWWEIVKLYGNLIISVLKGILEAFSALKRGDFGGIKAAYRNTMAAMGESTDGTISKIKQLWSEAAKAADDSEKTQTKTIKTEAAKRGQIRVAEAKQNKALLEKQQQEAKVLAELRIANIEDEFARRRAQADAAYAEQRAKYRNNAAILQELAIQHQRKLSEIDAAEQQKRQTEQQRAAQKQAELARQLEDLKISAIADGLARREAEIEAQFRRELEKWQGNAEAVLAVEQRKQQALAELARQRREAEQQAQERQWQDWQQQNVLWLNTARAGYGNFLSTILDAEMSAAEKRAALFNRMRDAFVNSLQSGLNKLIEVKLREIVVHTTAETTKTTVTQTQTATRSSISLAAVAKEIGRVLASVGAWLAQMTAKLFSWFASMGPLGILAGLGAVPALIASVKSLIKSAAKFKDGGVVKEQIFGLIGEAGDSEAVIPLNARGAEFMAQLVPQITVPVPVVVGAGGGTGITSEEFRGLKEDMVAAIRDIRIEIRSELDALQFFRKEFPNYEKAERERRL